MKITTKTAALLCVLFLSAFQSFSINYVSAGSGNWATATTWTPNGTPTSSDNVTIQAGHQVDISANGNVCRNLNLDGTLNFTANVSMVVYGNYAISATGVESAPVFGKISFFAPGTTLDCQGTSSAKLYYNFNSNRTLTGTFNKTSAYTQLAASKTITNLGNYTMGSVTTATGTTWINGANSTLSLRLVGFMAGRTFTCSATGNTVIIRYTAGALPTCTGNTFYNLTLAGTTAGAKTLAANTVISGNLTINSTNTLNTNNFDLSVGGNWTSNGTFTASTGKTVTLNGTTAAQNVSNATGTTTFKRLTINNANGVNLTSGTYILDEVLTVSDGTFNTGGRPFTMTSTATQTARIAPMGLTGAITGNFTIQRFITGRDTTWADFSSPVQSTTFADWESELPAITYTYSPPSQYPSAATYDEMADEYVPVTSSGTALNAGQGFEVFLTGDFSYSNFPATTMNTVGVPNQGDFDLSSMVSNTVQGWNLVGNPFASSVSWSSIYTASGGAGSGMYDYIEMYDYTIGDWNGYTSADGIEIGSTQGFWVYGLSGPMTLIIPESSKTTSSNSSIKSANIVQPYFTLKMSSANSNFAHIFKISANADGVDALDSRDIPFRKSMNQATPELYCMLEGKKININSFNSSNADYSIALKTKVNVAGKYRIDAAGFDFISEYTCVKLQDRLTSQVIDLTEGNGYCFTANPSDTPDRFILMLSKDEACSKSAIAPVAANFENEIEILPNTSGNTINFHLGEAANTTISLVNMLGQTITESQTLTALDQSVTIDLPAGYNGMYIVRVESANGAVTKKFVKK